MNNVPLLDEIDIEKPKKTLIPTPFLKWAGGKSQILSDLEKLFPLEYGTYYEPFLGGGAVYFRLRPENAILSDINEELINTYRVVRDNVEELIGELEKHKRDESYYYLVRDLKAEGLTAIERGSRFIFLNKTCFNGLHRVNLNGEFNVPFGKHKRASISDSNNLRLVSCALNNTKVEVADFEVILTHAQKDDFVYLDPPYHPTSKTSSFTKYSQYKFTEIEQQRLAQVFNDLASRGCKLMLTNSDTPFIRSLYNHFTITSVKARRMINCKGSLRNEVNELIIRNYT